MEENKNKCRFDTINSHIDGELSKAETKAYESHLKDCSECRKKADTLGELKLRFKKYNFSNPPEKIFRRAFSEYSRIKTFRRIALSAAAVFILFYFGFVREFERLHLEEQKMEYLHSEILEVEIYNGIEEDSSVIDLFLAGKF